MSTLEVSETIVDTVSDGEPMAVLRKRPSSGGPYPVVVVFHDGLGMRDATHVFVRRLAGCGYDVAVPDLYHRIGRMVGFSTDEVSADPAIPAKIREMITSLTDDSIQRDLDATLDTVRVQRRDSGAVSTESIGCIGFCLGARAVFRTMMRLPEQFTAGAMWHPSFLVDDGADSPHLTVGDLSGSLYAGFGEIDQIMSVAGMRPFIDATAALGDRAVIDIHPGADHGYTWPGSPTYNEAATERAWSQTLAMFEASLGEWQNA